MAGFRDDHSVLVCVHSSFIPTHIRTSTSKIQREIMLAVELHPGTNHLPERTFPEGAVQERDDKRAAESRGFCR
jgi:hypothetical protein